MRSPPIQPGGFFFCASLCQRDRKSECHHQQRGRRINHRGKGIDLVVHILLVDLFEFLFHFRDERLQLFPRGVVRTSITLPGLSSPLAHCLITRQAIPNPLLLDDGTDLLFNRGSESQARFVSGSLFAPPLLCELDAIGLDFRPGLNRRLVLVLGITREVFSLARGLVCGSRT
jgi:hypothetical protein